MAILKSELWSIELKCTGFHEFPAGGEFFYTCSVCWQGECAFPSVIKSFRGSSSNGIDFSLDEREALPEFFMETLDANKPACFESLVDDYICFAMYPDEYPPFTDRAKTLPKNFGDNTDDVWTFGVSLNSSAFTDGIHDASALSYNILTDRGSVKLFAQALQTEVKQVRQDYFRAQQNGAINDQMQHH